MASLTIDLPEEVMVELINMANTEKQTKVAIIRQSIKLRALLRKQCGDSASVNTESGILQILLA